MRRMFGKTGVFCDGVMFAMVTDNTLYFRVDDENRAIFKEAEAFPPLNYAKKGAMIDLSFWRVPERLFDEPDELIDLGARRIGGGAPGRRSEGGANKRSPVSEATSGLAFSVIPRMSLRSCGLLLTAPGWKSAAARLSRRRASVAP